MSSHNPEEAVSYSENLVNTYCWKNLDIFVRVFTYGQTAIWKFKVSDSILWGMKGFWERCLVLYLIVSSLIFINFECISGEFCQYIKSWPLKHFKVNHLSQQWRKQDNISSNFNSVRNERCLGAVLSSILDCFFFDSYQFWMYLWWLLSIQSSLAPQTLKSVDRENCKIFKL